MTDTKTVLPLGGRTFILIGTAHVSRESIEEVRCAILEEKPGLVCVELDEARYSSMNNSNLWEKLDVTRVIKEGKGFLLIANLVLAGFQRRLGKKLGVKPGEEMKVAVETAQSQGIPYALCDREVHITLQRAWSKCGLWGKAKLLAQLLSGAFTTEKMSEADIENLKHGSELDNMMDELAAYLPAVKQTLIDERDCYLAAKIWTASPGAAARTAAPSPADAASPAAAPNVKTVPKILAVVGAGHLAGIRRELEKFAGSKTAAAEPGAATCGAVGIQAEVLAPLEQIPGPHFFSRLVPWIIPALLAVLVIWGVWKLGAQASIPLLLRWVLWNGSLAALGTIFALGHPLSVLVSFVGAPIATINPFVGVGLFSGITQAALCKPRVEDAESINDDISSLRGIYRNRISHALLVFFLSSLGGMAGNFISIPSIAGNLLK